MIVLSSRGLAGILIVFGMATALPAREAACHAQTHPGARRTGTQAAQAAQVGQPGQRRAPTAQLLAEAVAAFERGDDATARDGLQRALAADPQNVEAHTYLGALADRAGDLAKAAHHFAAAARLAPKSASARNNYGATLWRLKRTKEAATEFEASLRLDGSQANALVNLAQIRFAAGSPEDLRAADELFRRADQTAPDAEIARARIIIALRRNERTQAATYYRAYATRLTQPGIAGSNVAAPSVAAPNALTRAELGGALFEAGLLSEAEAELKAALALDPANVEAVMRLARVYLARKDIPAAGRTLETAVARGVNSAPLYALLADVYDKSGHPENAIPAMRLAIKLDPQSETYRFQYGTVLTNAYAPAAAIIRLNEALEEFPNSPRLWLAFGLANYKASKNEEAARALDRAIKLDPKFAQGYTALGMTRVELGQYNEGVALFEQALRMNAKLGVVHYLIADALLRQTDADIARIESHLRRAVEWDGKYTQARLALAKVLMRAERMTEAATELEQVVKLNPDLAETYYQLGRAYGRLKRTDEAKTALATFKRLSDSQKEQEQVERQDIVRRLADVRF